MFHAEYSSGQPLRILVDLRNVIDAALARSAKKTTNKPADAPSTRALAAAAGAQSAASTPEVPEFEVTSTPQEWDANSESDGTGSEGSDNN